MQTEPEKSDISLILVKNEKELQRYNLDEVARLMGDETAPRTYPIYLVFYRGSFRGYFHMVQQICVYPVLHPELMNIREYLKITRSLITEIKRTYGNPIFMLCDRALEAGAQGRGRVVKHVRLKRAPETAFLYDENAY
jgi:hypothetical protein